jgi:hypothetical protein
MTSRMHLVPCKLDSVMAYLCDASLTTVRLEMPKRQIDTVFIPSGKTIARLTELKIAYYLLLKSTWNIHVISMFIKCRLGTIFR